MFGGGRRTRVKGEAQNTGWSVGRVKKGREGRGRRAETFGMVAGGTEEG